MDKAKAFAVFAAVARASSFSHAANELGTTTSNVSRIVAQLESAVGVRLLHRTTRSVSLTAEGEQMLSRLVANGPRVSAETLKPLDAAEQRTLLGLLSRLT